MDYTYLCNKSCRCCRASLWLLLLDFQDQELLPPYSIEELSGNLVSCYSRYLFGTILRLS